LPAASNLAEDLPMPLFAHLEELRKRLMASLLILAVGTGVCFFYSQSFIEWLARPAGSLFFLSPLEAFQTRLKVSLFGGFLATMPLLFHQAWLFVRPALNQKARKIVLKLLPLSYFLFLSGVAICLWVALPATLRFLLSFGSENVKPMMTLNAYLGFVTKMALAFGGLFQMPLVLYGLNRLGIVDRKTLSGYRKVIYFGCFVLTAFMTPEVFSQVLLAVLTIILFEITLLTMR